MTLIVILNAALAIGIVGVILALHTRAIIADHRHHGSGRLWVWRPQPSPRVAEAPRSAPRAKRAPAAQRRTPAMVTD